MRVINLKDLSRKDYQRIIKRSFGSSKEIMPKVIRIIVAVKKNGEKAILGKYQQRYGKENYRFIKVTNEEIKNAYKEIDNNFIRAIKQMMKNIGKVHQAQLPKLADKTVYPEDGISVWRQWRPIKRVGFYIPGGKAVYPSSVLMTAIPAQIAGCKEIILCSPPGNNGQIPASSLVAADMVGLINIYKIGGVEAIAAMAYGIESMPKVDKIFGAGNSYVTAAKMQVLSEVAIDMPAGPSEIFIIADESANPKFIAADLLADGEHGPDSSCVLMTTSENIAGQVAEQIERQLRILSTADRVKESFENYGLIAIVDRMEEAINFVNDYAPEHLEIMTKNADELVEKIINAGSVFIGDWTTKSAGDYATGANHVLPTGGMAKMYPPLGVDSFGKWMQIQKCTKRGLSKIRKTIETIAEVEQLPAHKYSCQVRFEKL